MNTQQKLDYINQHIGVHPDFPKKGIVFRDIFGALTDGQTCKYLKEVLLEHVRTEHPDVDIIVGLESRGFLFNLMLASELGIGCAPIRKKGKLPGKCVSVEYTLEYGSDIFEMQTDAIKPGQKVLIIDDLLATGGSLEAAVKLVRKAGGEVVKCLVVMELEFLEGRKKVDSKVHSLLKY
ncbi:Adenine phosphoribosyltransferase [Lucilia cuprina]|uniref:Adenine phosphoribosyltransferase n=1 Tax=Lucilia cuprina TaxID=7375 RepID=A0A0L0CKH2_LUCCU|nr:adenine phosphoribosyltransferase [Lucilia cuprina]XP_046807936.1 adenine phosphoribosyltransferase [Lucilia cuprina]KAI8115514.1 Adenine phosphoribosyltransferase [Lucilia cuprina]KNC32727.1 Adenine phosphoribosyltransferase [Lucilia cuprina]